MIATLFEKSILVLLADYPDLADALALIAASQHLRKIMTASFCKLSSAIAAYLVILACSLMLETLTLHRPVEGTEASRTICTRV